AELGWGQQNPAFRQFFTTQFIPGGTPEQHRWFNELERISTSPVNAGRFMRVFNEIDVVSLLPQVSCPTLVLHCVRDARVPFAEGRLIASLIRARVSCRSRATITCCSKTSWLGGAGSTNSGGFCPSIRSTTRRSPRSRRASES